MNDKTKLVFAAFSIVSPVALPALLGALFPVAGLIAGLAAGGTLGIVFWFIARDSSSAVPARVGFILSVAALIGLVSVLLRVLIPGMGFEETFMDPGTLQEPPGGEL